MQNSSPLRKMLEYAEAREVELEEEMGLKYPEKISQEEMNLWVEYYNILKQGYENEIIVKEDVVDFEKKFFNLSTSEKSQYIDKLNDLIQEKIVLLNRTMGYLKKNDAIQNIDIDKKALPQNLQPLFEYLAYSVITGNPIPEVELKEIELALSPQGQEAQIQQNLQRTIDQYRRNPLNAARMAQGANFNQPYTRQQVAKILDEAQGLPTNQQSQRIQPRSQAPTPNQQRRRNAPNIEFIQSSNRPVNSMPRMPSPAIQQNIPKKNTPQKNSPPVMRQAMKMPVARPVVAGIDQTKSLLDQTSGVNKHNKGLDELL